MKPPLLSDEKPDLWDRLWGDMERQFVQGSSTFEARGLFAQAGDAEQARESVMVATPANTTDAGGEPA